MEGMNESFDVNKVFSDVEKYVEEYKSVDSGSLSENIKLYKALSVEVVSGLTDILKNISSKPKFEESEIANRFCEIVDEISDSSGSLWEFALRVKGGKVMISFLKELATNGRVPQIDKIFMSGGGHYPLVNKISCNYEDKFNELFSMLPEDYRDKLSGEIISYQDGDKDYAYPLIGGSALMGF